MSSSNLGPRRGAILLTVIVAVVSATAAGPLPDAKAATATPPFTECPAIGHSPSCEILLVVNQDNTISVLGDPSVGPFDGGDDTLVGIVNQSSNPVSAVTMSGPGSGLSGFDGDGICSGAYGTWNGSSGCPYGPTGYEGPGTAFVTSSSLPDSAEVDFAPPLAGGASAYFSLEGALTSAELTARPGTLLDNVQVWQPQDSASTPFVQLTGLQLTSGTSQIANVTLQVENDASHTFQQMTGFGGTMTDSSAYLMDASNPLLPDLQPSPTAITELFAPPNGASSQSIGLDLVRIPIGGNDFSQTNYSPDCENSNHACSTANNYPSSPSQLPIAVDQQYLIPTLQAALAANPNLQFIASPWSAPPWMKCRPRFGLCRPSTGTLDGGQLRPGEELRYAQYLVDWIEAYQKAHLPIAAITIDNEPFNTHSNYPIMTMSVPQQETVIEDVARQLKAAGLSTQIIGLDHNWRYVGQANQLLSSPAGQYLSGIAFHCYERGSDPTAQLSLPAHEPIYEDECTPTGAYANVPSTDPNYLTTDPADFANDLAYNTLQEVIQSVAYGSKSVMLYDLAANGPKNYGPTINTYGSHGTGGCGPITPTTTNTAMAHKNCLPLVAIPGPGASAVPNVGYAVLGDVSRYVKPGAHRIFSTLGAGNCTHMSSGFLKYCDVWSVAFENPDGTIVLVVLNDSGSPQTVAVDWNGQSFVTPSTSPIPPKMVQTFVWSSSS